MFDLDSSLGVSVCGEDLVLTAVAKGIQGYALKSFAVISGYAELEAQELQSRVRSYVQSNRVNRENVILGLPRAQVVIRQMELPLEVEENLRQVVRFQVEKLEPGEEDTSWFDHLVLERDEKAKSVTLQIAMSPAERLGAWLKLFRELDLFPAAIRPACLGYHQIFKAHRDGLAGEPSLVVDFGAKDLEIALVGGAASCFSQSWEIDADDFGLESVLRRLDEFVSRLRLSSAGVRKIYLTGARGAELLEAFRERFGACEPLEEGLKLKLDGGAKRVAANLSQALGLALSGLEKSPPSRLNLIPPERRETGQRPSFVPTLVLAGLLLVMVGAVSTREFFQQEQRLRAIEGELAKLRPEQEKVQDIRRQVDSMIQEAQELQEFMNGRQAVLLVLKDLTEKIPDDSYLQSLAIQRDKANMTGFSDSAASLISVLQSSQYLKNVEQRYINRDPRTGKERFNFEARVELPGEVASP